MPPYLTSSLRGAKPAYFVYEVKAVCVKQAPLALFHWRKQEELKTSMESLNPCQPTCGFCIYVVYTFAKAYKEVKLAEGYRSLLHTTCFTNSTTLAILDCFASKGKAE
jgi:hypothetical protein